MKKIITALFMICSQSHPQTATSPFVEHFDSVEAPVLPAGWTTTKNRSSTGDFVTTSSSAHSQPNAVYSTNATVTQALTSATINFSGQSPTKLEFFASRSSTHTAGLLVEASFDDGITFPISLCDTIHNPGSTAYVLTSLPLPPSLGDQARVRIRWRLIGTPGGGVSGAFRMDDISISTIPRYDLALSGLRAIATSDFGQSLSTQPVSLRATVKNVGSLTATGYSIRFFKDANGNSRADSGEEFGSVTGTAILPSDSATFEIPVQPLNAGDHRFLAVVEFGLDGNRANDTASSIITIGAEPKSLVINEIMFDPLPGQNEWFELYHRGSNPVDIARWKFSGRSTASAAPSFTIAENSVTILPHDFVVVAADSTVLSQYPYLANAVSSIHLLILNKARGFSLNNDGDDLVIRDALGRTIDSVAYLPSWHHPDLADTKGRSLERVSTEIGSNDARNWSSSPASAGGTPGKTNGLYAASLPGTASISINPNPFSPDGDGFEDMCIIHYNLPMTTSLIRITIFDIRGRLIRTLANSELSGPHGDIVWDGLDDNKERLRIGPYIVFIEAIDARGGILATAKAVAVVATKL